MTRPRLLNDVCRCHDAECPMRGDCLRWIERSIGADWTPHAATMREPGTECRHLIAATAATLDAKETTSKHTPGPWEYTTFANPYDDWGTVRDKAGNLVGFARNGYVEFDDNECRLNRRDPFEANARLIAAAPELLKALTVAVERQGFTNAELIEARRILKKAMEG